MTEERPLLPQYRLYTVDDYDRLPNDGRRFELIDGELIEKDGEGIGQDRPMGAADIDFFPQEGPRYEILEGVLFPLPAPDVEHQLVVLSLLRGLDRAVTATGAGEVLVAPPSVVLGEHDVALPDLAFISSSRRGIVGTDRIVGAPDLVVEVSMLPTIARDWGRKRSIYRRAGVGEYWTVNLVTGEIVVWTPLDDWRFQATPSPVDGLLRSTLLPALIVDRALVFRSATAS